MDNILILNDDVNYYHKKKVWNLFQSQYFHLVMSPNDKVKMNHHTHKIISHTEMNSTWT
jgi:hypothetical protein